MRKVINSSLFTPLSLSLSLPLFAITRLFKNSILITWKTTTKQPLKFYRKIINIKSISNARELRIHTYILHICALTCSQPSELFTLLPIVALFLSRIIVINFRFLDDASFDWSPSKAAVVLAQGEKKRRKLRKHARFDPWIIQKVDKTR